MVFWGFKDQVVTVKKYSRFSFESFEMTFLGLEVLLEELGVKDLNLKVWRVCLKAWLSLSFVGVESFEMGFGLKFHVKNMCAKESRV